MQAHKMVNVNVTRDLCLIVLVMNAFAHLEVVCKMANAYHASQGIIVK